jgi:C-terminal processing protease CtpA/Prc
VKDHLQNFTPEFALDPKRFTPLHAMVVSPAPKGAWRFTKPVAVLIDSRCFSATDIFLGALELLDQVRLYGTPTGGGSGRARRYTLKHTGLEVKLSSMASFRASGRRYDGRGIAPDGLIKPTLAAHLRDEDAVLAHALKHFEVLRKRRR